MGLSYHYSFTAPPGTTAEELERFLHEVKQTADALGFGPNAVLNLAFDTPERQQFSRRLGGSFILEDERLEGMVMPAPGQLSHHDPINGSAHLIPKQGVVLVVGNKQEECEACFGFFRFPEEIVDVHGRTILKTEFDGSWAYRNHVDSPDRRYREIVARFAAAGYVTRVHDEFV